MPPDRSQPPLWRPILPHTGSNVPAERPPQPRLPPRRKPIAVACERCREAKGKCNGVRPSCGACIRKGRQCVYRSEPNEPSGAALKRKHSELQDEHEQLRRSHDALQRIVSALQVREETEASAIVRRLRDTKDPEAVARHLEAGDLLLQLHVAADTKFRFNFPYRRDMPKALLTSLNPYLNSLLYESTFASPPLSPTEIAKVERLKPQYLKPYSAARIADTRLTSVDLSRWTNVSSDNNFMRKLLHDYLLLDYQAFPFFHKDYFLDDLLSGSARFCSTLLVNAVLAHACSCCKDVQHREEYWNPHLLSYKFFAEARRLWELEGTEPHKVTTVQAGMVMNVTYNVYSMDKIGLTYGAQAVTLATEMGLFKLPTEVVDKSRQVVHDYTAWCLYFSMSFQCFHLMVPCPIRDPPAAALPDPEKDPGWYGEFWLQYPSNQTMIPMEYPRWSRLKLELNSIMRPVAEELFDNEEKRADVQRQLFFAYTVSRLRTIYSALPSALRPAQVVFPFHIGLHMWYHNLVLSVSQLLVEVLSNTGSAEMLNDAQKQVEHSRICLETLLRLYYLRNGYEASNMWLLHFLTVLSFMTLRDLEESTQREAIASDLLEDTRSTLILTAKGLHEQGKNYFMSFTISHVLRGQMATEDLGILDRHCTMISESSDLKKARASHVKAQYPLTIVKKSNNQETQRLGDMIKKYEALALEQSQ